MVPAHGPRLVILGRQGSGKGTQGARLAERLGIDHIATGTLLRAAVAAGTPLGRQVEAFLEEGRLVPDELVTQVVADAIGQPEVDRRGWLLDGFPRTRAQAESLLGLLGPDGLTAAVLLDVSIEEVTERMASRRVCRVCDTPTTAPAGEEQVPCPACGGPAVRRADDTPGAIARRLATFDDETGPAIAVFAEHGLLVTADGCGAPDVVFQRVLQAVGPVLWGKGQAVG